MAKKALKRLYDFAINAADPERPVRIAAQAAALERYLARDRKSLDLFKALDDLHVPRSDVSAVVELAYENLLKRAWHDEALSQSEIADLRWVREVLQIQGRRAVDINASVCMERFKNRLLISLDKGITNDDIESLERIAVGMNSSVVAIVQSNFAAVASDWARRRFRALTSDMAIDHRQWNSFLKSLEFLCGTSTRKMLQGECDTFMQHVIADFKSDDQLSENECHELSWLIQNLFLSEKVLQYAQREVDNFHFELEASQGRLPICENPGIELRAGELIHFVDAADYVWSRESKSGTREEFHSGTIVVTDNRVIFSSSSRNVMINHRQVVRIRPTRSSIHVLWTKVGEHRFAPASDLRRLSLIWRTAIAKVNQTVIEQSNERSTRHIPRDVRQRVWQKYGGKCAECAGSNYLEFDHIIPVARGGNNSDNNVQLLCRACNLRKSAFI